MLKLVSERLKTVLELSSEWYWEQDENYHFTMLIGASFGESGLDPQDYVGKARWDAEAVPVSDNGSWDPHKAVLQERQPFTDFVFRRVDAQGEMRYINTSGQPVFEGERFKGYRGVAKDVTASQRAEQLLRVARLGGDEFVVLVQEVGTADDAATIADKILSAALKPVDIAGQECRVTASIGICMYPTGAQDEQSLMKNADVAMYSAKEKGKNNFQFYSPDIHRS